MCYQNITSHYKAIMLFSSMVSQTNDNDFLLRLLDKPLVEQTSDAQNVLSFLMVFGGRGGGVHVMSKHAWQEVHQENVRMKYQKQCCQLIK